MKRIHTISLNTAVDMHMVVPKFQLGTVMRSDSYNEFASGKAVNNARTIACLGAHVALYCFSGVNDVDLFSAISSLVKSNVLPVDGATRRNLTLVTHDAELICHIQNQGYSVTEAQLAQLETTLVAQLRAEDVVVISGSIPQGVPSDYLNQLVSRIVQRNATVLLDVDPVLLGRVDCNRVALVKPNLEELSRLAGRNIVEIADIVNTAHNLITSGIIVVSLGQNGAIWVDRNNRWYVHAKGTSHDQGSADVIGCGDAMVGAFALGLADNKAPMEILRMGIAAGYANMFAEGPGVISLDHYGDALSKVDLGTTNTL